MAAKPASSNVLTSTPRISAPTCSPRRVTSTMAPPPLHLPGFCPARVRAHALLLHLHVDEIRPVLLGGLLHAAPQGGLQLLQRGHALAVHALGARQRHVVGGRAAQLKARILPLAHHLGVRHLARPVVAHDLVRVVVRHHGEHGGVVARHGPEARRAVGERAVAQVQHHRPPAAPPGLGPDGRARPPPAAILAPMAAPTPNPTDPPPLRVHHMPRWPSGKSAARAVLLSCTMAVSRGRMSARCASSTAGCTVASCSCSRTRSSSLLMRLAAEGRTFSRRRFPAAAPAGFTRGSASARAFRVPRSSH